jgi:hypothetical protein
VRHSPCDNETAVKPINLVEASAEIPRRIPLEVCAASLNDPFEMPAESVTSLHFLGKAPWWLEGLLSQRRIAATIYLSLFGCDSVSKSSNITFNPRNVASAQDDKAFEIVRSTLPSPAIDSGHFIKVRKRPRAPS